MIIYDRVHFYIIILFSSTSFEHLFTLFSGIVSEAAVRKYCNEELKVIPGEGGFINSPGYPLYYLGESTCGWTFRSAPGHRIVLTFHDLNIRGKYRSVSPLFPTFPSLACKLTYMDLAWNRLRNHESLCTLRSKLTNSFRSDFN